MRRRALLETVLGLPQLSGHAQGVPEVRERADAEHDAPGLLRGTGDPAQHLGNQLGQRRRFHRVAPSPPVALGDQRLGERSGPETCPGARHPKSSLRRRQGEQPGEVGSRPPPLAGQLLGEPHRLLAGRIEGAERAQVGRRVRAMLEQPGLGLRVDDAQRSPALGAGDLQVLEHRARQRPRRQPASHHHQDEVEVDVLHACRAPLRDLSLAVPFRREEYP